MAVGILERLQGDLTEYKSIPFWSWNDDLKPEHLRRQIREMNEAGIGGFFMHARGGLMTEYMGEEWMKCCEACIDEAKKQGMKAWAYDENGWPSGFAGMKLLENPDNFAHYLVFEHTDRFDPAALGCYRLENGNLVRVTDDDGEGCECVYDRINDSVVDILNWKVVRAFIDETHEKYYKRFSKDFGKLLMGFFTDEPQYFRYETAYTPVLLNKYRSKYGSELTDELGALFIDCAQSNRFRYRYWLMMNELYTESFAGQIYRWCTEHNIQLTGHSIEECMLYTQMWSCAGIMPFYEYEHIPGVDWLGRDISTELTPRQVSSVAMQLGKKHVLTESFAGCGWDVSPTELKHILEWQFVNGVNLVCQHLYPYSIRGQRKRDFPAFYSNHNPWTKDFRHFNDYFTRLGYLLAESREVADTLVIHPIHSAYFTFKRGNDRMSTKTLDDSFAALVEKLGAAGIGHHYADETLLKKYGSVKNKKLHVGKCAYSTVIVPDMEGMDESTLNILTDFAKEGGKICFVGAKKPHLINGEERSYALDSNIALEDIANPGFRISDKTTDIRLTVRRSDFGDFVYAVNLSTDMAQKTVFHINARGARKFNAEIPAFEPVYFEKSEQGIDIPLCLKPCESIIVFLSATADSAEKPVAPVFKTVSNIQGIIGQADPNTLTVDSASLSYDGVTYTEPMNVMAISDRLLHEGVNRTVYLKYTFEVEAKPACIRLEAEDMNGAQALLNGEEITSDRAGDLDFQFKSYDISKLLRIGKNELVFRLDYYQPEHTYSVFNGVYYTHDGTTESKLNCLSYYTDIEAVYLRGDFCVGGAEYRPGKKNTLITSGGFNVTLPRKYISLDRLYEDGFPFFGGSLKFRTVINAEGTERFMRLNGRFATAQVSVNGGKNHFLMFDDTVNVAGELKKGENSVEITLTTALRNTLGIHHNAGDPDPYLYGPDSVTCYGSWKDGKSDRFDENYAFVFFGLKSLEIG